MVLQELGLARINPHTKKEELPNHKPHRIFREILDIDGNGGQILATLGAEVIRFQNEAVEVAKNGLEMGFGGNWPNDLECLLYLYLRVRDL